MKNSNWRNPLALLLGLLGAASITLSLSVDVTVEVTPEDARYGWAGPEAVSEAAPIAATMPPFRIVGNVGDNEPKNVRLWEYSQSVNGGKHFPNYAQQVGDCVSFGMKNAVEYLQAVQIVRDGFHANYRGVYPPYIYGVSRVQIGGGRLGSSDGSLGVWAAKAVSQYGILAVDADQVPSYSGRIAREWGRRGPPEWALSSGKEQLVKTVAQIKSATDGRDSICNGYPFTIASNFGSTDIRQRDGRMVARWNSSWAHQMCVIAYDGSGDTNYFYVLNSWGERAHPQPVDGEPPGGFWVTERDLDRIVRQGDSWAISAFEGFPAQDLDFRIMTAAPGDVAAPQFVAVAKQKDHAMVATGLTLGCFLVFASAVLLLSPRRRTIFGVLALSLLCCQASAAEPVFKIFPKQKAVAINFRALPDCPEELRPFRAIITTASTNPECDCLLCNCEDCDCRKGKSSKAQKKSRKLAKKAAPVKPTITVYVPNFGCPACERCKSAAATEPSLSGFDFVTRPADASVSRYPTLEWDTPKGKHRFIGWPGSATFLNSYRASVEQ